MHRCLFVSRVFLLNLALLEIGRASCRERVFKDV